MISTKSSEMSVRKLYIRVHITNTGLTKRIGCCFACFCLASYPNPPAAAMASAPNLGGIQDVDGPVFASPSTWRNQRTATNSEAQTKNIKLKENTTQTREKVCQEVRARRHGNASHAL
jgi:hypothetical protein